MDYDELNIGYSLGLTSSFFKLAAMSVMKENICEVTPEQYAILFILTKKDGAYQRQIAQLLTKDRPNITRMITILEGKGFLKRQKTSDNKRISKVFITQKGADVVEKIEPILTKLSQRATEGLSEAESTALLKTLEKIRVNLKDSFNIQT